MTWLRRYQHLLYPVLDFPLNAINYLYVILISRGLVVSEYGRASSLLAMFGILIALGITLQLTVAKQVSDSTQATPGAWGRPALAALLGGTTLLFVLLSIPLMNLLHSSFLDLGLLWLAFQVHLVISVLRGQLQGREQFLRLNGSLYVEILSKVACAALLLPRWPSVSAVLASSLCGMVCALCYHVAVQGVPASSRIGGFSWQSNRAHLRDGTNFFGMQVTLQYFMGLDLIVLNYFQSELTGYYAALVRYGQLVVYLALSIQTVLLPRLNRQRRSREQPPLGLLLAGWGGFTLVMVIVYATVAPWTVPLLFGVQYAPISRYLPVAAFCYSLLAGVNGLMLTFVLAGSARHYAALLPGALALLVGYVAFHSTIAQMLTVQGLVYTSVLLVLLFAYIRLSFKLRSAYVRL